MTGGVAYVLSGEGKDLALNADVAARRIVDVDSPAAQTLLDLVRAHHVATDSKAAADLLADWPAALPRFFQVLPRNDLDKPEHAVVVTAVLKGGVSSETQPQQQAPPAAAAAQVAR